MNNLKFIQKLVIYFSYLEYKTKINLIFKKENILYYFFMVLIVMLIYGQQLLKQIFYHLYLRTIIMIYGLSTKEVQLIQWIILNIQPILMIFGIIQWMKLLHKIFLWFLILFKIKLMIKIYLSLHIRWEVQFY